MEDKFYNLALRFLSYRPRSEKEVREKLKSKKIEPHIIEKIILKLKEKEFINDKEFTKGWIESRLRFKPRSARLIALELKRKGIEEDIVSEMISNEGLMINDLKLAKRLVEKKIERFKSMSKQEIYQKLGRFLVSKGFNWDTIKKAIDEALSKGV